jgi:uncharacterized protein (TIGR02757 family)
MVISEMGYDFFSIKSCLPCINPVLQCFIMHKLKQKLDELYDLYNDRKYVHPDPLEFLYNYPDPLDMELVGLIASSLAYGRVAQILKSVSSILEKMHGSPRKFLMASSDKAIKSAYSGFKHRFTTGEEMAAMLISARELIEEYGTLQECFLKSFKKDDETVLPALAAFVKLFNGNDSDSKNSLLPSPDKGSACKRLNLFLRWMVREDKVDPGGWKDIPASKLIIPLDTHMYRICSSMNMTCRKPADMTTALEITDYFRKISPEDPVRYDFAITRLGIRSDATPETFLAGLA